MSMESTICAIATAPGGAIGIVRISGPEAIPMTSGIFHPAGGLPLERRKAYSVSFGRIMEEDEVLDEVLVSVFRAPHSYTGQDSCEIACHGSRYILQNVLRLLVDRGCRMAEPGEFTRRAFLNGKMDLSQAEAVADLVASSSRASHRLAMSQMRGAFSRELRGLRDELLRFSSLLELELDFSDHEDVQFADRSQMMQVMEKIKEVLSHLADSFMVGNAIKNGIPTAIVGKTNVGKSTLLNALLGEDRALVSDISGTTRDAIEDTAVLNGILFRFIDTAGIRKTEDAIEHMGIERSFEKMEGARIILWMLDATCLQEQISELWNQVMPFSKEKKVILVINKEDLLEVTDLTAELPEGVPNVTVSAKLGLHLNELKERLVQAADIPEITGSDVVVTNLRHYEALRQAEGAAVRVLDGLRMGISGDFIAQDSRECIHHLSDIIGEVSSQDILSNIFSHFCIGK